MSKERVAAVPGLTVTNSRLNRPFGTTVWRKGFLDGLRQAGLPTD